MAGLRSVRARLFAIILAVALPLAGVLFYVWWRALDDGRERETALLRSRLSQIERSMADLRHQTEWVMANMARRPAFRALQPSSCADEMAVLRNVNDAFLAVTLWRRDGGLVCSSYPLQPGAPPPRPHRASFDAGLAAGDLYLSNVFRGEISGLDLVTFIYPVRDATGAIQGLLSMPLRVEYFERLLRLSGTSGDSVAGLADGNYRLVAREPGGAPWRGTSAARIIGQAGSNDLLAGAQEGRGVDGVRRIYVRTQIAGTGWWAYVGFEEAKALAGLRRQLREGGAAFAVVLVLSLALAFRLGRGITAPVRALARVADEVAKGERATRAVVPVTTEFAQLAHGFNRMLDALGDAERALRRREEGYRALVESSPDAKMIHQDRRIVLVNSAMLRLLRAGRTEDLIGKPYDYVMAGEHHAESEARTLALYAGESQPRVERVFRRLDGTLVDVEVAAAPLELDGRPAAQVTVRDITRRKAAERLMHESMARARQLSARLMRAEESERKRIAHDLHDQVGQELTALKIRLETMARSEDSQAARSKAQAAADLAGETLERVRRMSVDLRPPHLDSLGLAAALRAHVERLTALGALALHFDSRDCPRNLPADVEIMCFRVAQEALTNVMRHAHAANAWVSVGERDGKLRLSVRDDGCGFDVEQRLSGDAAAAGYGLLGMQERVALAGGTLEIVSRLGGGCTVTAVFPLAGEG